LALVGARAELWAEGELDTDALADADAEAFVGAVVDALVVVVAAGFFDVQPTPIKRMAAMNKAARFIVMRRYRAGCSAATRTRLQLPARNGHYRSR
jgi:hypothetical protein